MEVIILQPFKCTVISLFLFVVILNSAGVVNAQYTTLPTAGIAINGKTVDGIKPIYMNGTHYLPFVQLSKTLGYNHIRYEQNTATFQVTDGSTTVRATVGGTRAKKGNEYLNIDPLRWINNVAYIPLSSGGNLFNSYIYFKPENGSIQVQKPAGQYIVQRGDSLWRIAQAHHTTVAAIKSANRLTSNIVYIGQNLKIPPRDEAQEIEPIFEKEPVPQKHSSILTVRANVIEQAKQYLGAGYKFGATLNEAPNLFDCSSFTQLVFQQNNVQIPRVSRDQASKGVTVSQLEAGDLLFFTNRDLYSDGRVGHVGIYMGDGSMIHASSSRGVSITPNVLRNSYWGANYLFAKRVIHE